MNRFWKYIGTKLYLIFCLGFCLLVIFFTFRSAQLLGEYNIIAGIGDILFNFLWLLIFLVIYLVGSLLWRTVNDRPLPIVLTQSLFALTILHNFLISKSLAKGFGSKSAKKRTAYFKNFIHIYIYQSLKWFE